MDLKKMQGLIQGIKDIREETNARMSPEEADELNRQGVAEYKAQNYGKAFALFLQAAENGDAWGMYNVGRAYRDGEGTLQNMEEAFRWIKKAAQKSIVDAMFETGKMCYRGEGTEQDAVQAFAWCKKAAEEGHVWAMNWTADFYRQGEGVMEDKVEAFKWHDKASDEGNVPSALDLAFMYANGEGCTRDPDAAIELHETLIKCAQEENDNELLQQTTESLRQLGHLFNDQYEHWSKLEINSGRLVSDEVHDLYGKYLDCLKKAGALGNDTAQKEFDRQVSSCFITTAVCGSFGKPDNCYELTSFRNFRDKWLVNQADGKALIAEYYEIAPEIVRRINSMGNAKEIYRSIWDNYLQPCLTYIEQGSFAKCKETYINMVRELAKKY